MKQYELAIRIAQIHHLVDERKYKKALAVIQTLDMHQIRGVSDLKVFAEVYTKTEQYDAAKATYLRIYRRSRTKRILYRLIYLSIRTNSLTEAESYYQEFVRMNPNIRDSLILRYRIDKAAGAPPEQLIEILKQLKQEEYIEEWAYELAKLYHKTGRKEECIEECEDIILWFGTGEIVQRAKLLIEHLTEKEPITYEEKDFTLPQKEEPNPDDTGSLPDLDAFIREQKAKKREERKEGWFFKRDSGRDIDWGEDEEEIQESKKEKPAVKPKKTSSEKKTDDDYDDDYEDDDFDTEGLGIQQIAKDGIQMLSEFLKFGKKEEKEDDVKVYHKETKKDETEKASVRTEEQPSQSVTKKNEKQELSPQKELPKEEASRPEQREKKEPPKMSEYFPPSQSGTGITQDLAREISAIYEMEQREQLQEKNVTLLEEEENPANLAEDVVHRMTKALKKNPTKTTKTYIPLDVEEIRGDERIYEVNGPEEKTKVIEPIQDFEQEEMIPAEKQLEAILEQEATEIQQVMAEEATDVYAEQKAQLELQGKNQTEVIKELLEEHVEGDPVYPEEEPIEESESAYGSEPASELSEEGRYEKEPESAYGSEPASELSEEERYGEEPDPAYEQEEKPIEESESAYEQEEELAEEPKPAYESEEAAATAEEGITQESVEPERKTSVLDGYQAPEIPVYENSYMQIPDEVSYKDLPTTRALHKSFADVLQLIRGELEPSHFVLMGHGSERVVGVAKKIVRVVKETGFLSEGRIAKVTAMQINNMDLVGFKSQLKGNCLLIEDAADLMLPTLSIILTIMDEYQGEFVVILVDEGTTLDQLFRFTPKLAKRFKYIIDISQYTPEDYE